MKLKFRALGQLLLLIGLAVPHAYSQTCVPPPQGMISWWTADGTTLDYFGLNDGLTSSLVSYAPGEVADAFSFNGSQFVQVPRSASLEPAQITVDAWVNAAGSPGLAKYIVSKGALDEQESSYALYTGASGGLQFYVFDGTNVNVSPDAGTGVWDGTWHHIAGTYDQTAVRLFLDGTEVGTGTPATTSIAYGLSAGTDVTNDLFFGDYNPNCSSAICLEDHHFTGEVDETEYLRARPSIARDCRYFHCRASRQVPAGKDGYCKKLLRPLGLGFRKQYYGRYPGIGGLRCWEHPAAHPPLVPRGRPTPPHGTAELSCGGREWRHLPGSGLPFLRRGTTTLRR